MRVVSVSHSYGRDGIRGWGEGVGMGWRMRIG
jgi:hypothetical protein